MKQFITKVTIFLSLIALVVGAFEYRLYKIPNTYSVKHEQFESRLNDWQIIAFGTSHSVYGVRADVYGVPGYNLAYNTQSLYYDHELLKNYIDRLPNLKLVILPVSYFSLEMSLPKTKEDWRAFFYERYFGITPEEGSNLMSPKRYSMMQLYGQEESMDYAAQGFNINLAAGITPGGNYFYGKEYSVAPGDDATALIRVAEHHEIMFPEQVATNAAYLRSMIELTLAHGATPVIITTPVRSSYARSVDPIPYAELTTTLTDIAEEYGIEYHNYFTATGFEDELFYDCDHLNMQGATRFSELLKTDIVNPVLNKQNP